MKFEQLDRRMRVFETAHDHCVLPGIHMVARIDGRSFSHLTRVAQAFDAPYDVRFRDHMVAALVHVMGCGFSTLYGYTQSDEMNVLFRRDESTFGRKLRKLDSILAGEASGKFSLLLGTPAAFDCRISQLPTADDVVDYFRWRHEDAHRNALNAHCYWLLRRQGRTDHEATKELSGVSVAGRNELLFRNGINFNDLPTWEKRGIGTYWEDVVTEGTNPHNGEAQTKTRRRVVTDFELPMKDAYDAFVRRIVEQQ
jgi:tRNA(His) 5'-end guanylyltransferase